MIVWVEEQQDTVVHVYPTELNVVVTPDYRRLHPLVFEQLHQVLYV